MSLTKAFPQKESTIVNLLRVIPLLLGLIGALLTATVVEASVFYVDAARPDDLGDGTTWATAKLTIPAAIAVSAPGDEILVKYGSYVAVGAIHLSTDRKITSDDGTHDSFETAAPDPSQCVISGANLNRIFTITGISVTGETSIRGFQIVQGRATNDPMPTNGGGILISGDADPVIEQCWIIGNTAGHSGNGTGGGIACLDSGTNPTIHDCRISTNLAAGGLYVGYGGGIYGDLGASPNIYRNTIDGNIAAAVRIGYGGGICVYSGQIWSNTISNNVGSNSGSAADGGGVCLIGAGAEVRDNTITGNVAARGVGWDGRGGGICCAAACVSPIIHHNIITDNIGSLSGPGYGGGIKCSAGRSTIEDNIITNNTATESTSQEGYGGGLYLAGSNYSIARGNIIASNTASLNWNGSGGGIYFDSRQTIERNCIYRNVASAAATGYGGGIWSYASTGATVRNNTLYRNANSTAPGAGTHGKGSGLYHYSGGTPTIANNVFVHDDVEGSDMMGIFSEVAVTIHYNAFHANPGGNYNSNVTSLEETFTGSGPDLRGTACAIPLADGNRSDLDPRFADPDNGDFTLLFDSPLIEAGDPATGVPEDGGWRVDIGAVEYTAGRQYQTVTEPGELLFGGLVKAKVGLSEIGSLSAIDATVHVGENHEGAPESVRRWYDFVPTGGDAIFDLTLSYKEEELNGLQESELALWRWTGSAWQGPVLPSARDTEENWITGPAQTEFGQWIIAEQDMLAAVHDPATAGRFGIAVIAPNPFRERTTLRFDLPGAGAADLSVFAIDGRLVRTIVRGPVLPGASDAAWDGRDDSGRLLPPGVYFVRLRTTGRTEARAVTLLK